MDSALRWLTPSIEAVQATHRARLERFFACPEPALLAIDGPMPGSSHGLWGTNAIDMLAEPDAWLDDVFASMEASTNLYADRRTYRPLLIETDALGTHYIDALLGAHVRFHEGQAWPDPLHGAPEHLQPPDLTRSPVFLRSLALARRALERTEGRVLLSTPVLSCPVNIGMNLFGGRLLEDLAARPEAARHALRVITDVIAQCTRAFIDTIPEAVRRASVGCSRCMPAGYGLIDGCATHLLSGRHYADHFADLDASLLGLHRRGGMIHLCGAHAQHLTAWRKMPALACVQLNDRAAEDIERYDAALRADQILYAAPCETVPVERILSIGRRRRVVLQATLPDGM